MTPFESNGSVRRLVTGIWMLYHYIARRGIIRQSPAGKVWGRRGLAPLIVFRQIYIILFAISCATYCRSLNGSSLGFRSVFIYAE